MAIYQQPKSVSHDTLGLDRPALPASDLLKPIEHNGQPPQDVMTSLLLPSDSVLAHVENQSTGGYDTLVQVITKNLGFQDAINFFNSALKNNKWSVQSTSLRPKGYQILAKYASNDGYYWELGILLTPDALTNPPTTIAELRLYEPPDPD